MIPQQLDINMIREALRVARQAPASEIPVGAAVFDKKGNLVVSRHNLLENSLDVTAHAEILAIRDACGSKGSKYLTGHTIAVTLEPCGMCSIAIREARLARVIFGAFSRDTFSSRYDLLRDSSLGPVPEVRGGVLELECSEMLQRRFGFLRLK